MPDVFDLPGQPDPNSRRAFLVSQDCATGIAFLHIESGFPFRVVYRSGELAAGRDWRVQFVTGAPAELVQVWIACGWSKTAADFADLVREFPDPVTLKSVALCNAGVTYNRAFARGLAAVLVNSCRGFLYNSTPDGRHILQLDPVVLDPRPFEPLPTIPTLPR